MVNHHNAPTLNGRTFMEIFAPLVDPLSHVRDGRRMCAKCKKEYKNSVSARNHVTKKVGMTSERWTEELQQLYPAVC